MTTNNQSRLAAQSLGPVAWVQPNYLMALEKVGLVTAYVEKHRKADYEQRIRSALVNVPMSASDGAMRQALNEVVTNGEWTEGDQCGEWKISKAVYDLAVEARDSILAASEATKSDVEAPAATTVERPGTVTSESEPSTSDTAPLDFSTVEIDRDFYFTWPNGAHKTSPELLALLERAKNHVMTPEEVYEQRRSFVRGMCPSNRDYGEWCEQVDRLIPPLPGPSDTIYGECTPITVGASSVPSDPHEPATVLTKGGEGPAYIGRPGDARNLYEDSARDTRPADVTVKELASSVMTSCSAIWAHEARQIARALLDTYKIGAK